MFPSKLEAMVVLFPFPNPKSFLSEKGRRYELNNQSKTFGFVDKTQDQLNGPFKLFTTTYVSTFFMYGTYDLRCFMSQQDKLLEKITQ